MTSKLLTLFTPLPEGGLLFVGSLSFSETGAVLVYPSDAGQVRVELEEDHELACVRASAQLLGLRALRAFHGGTCQYEIQFPQIPVGK
jgi:hypothetical protein